MKIGEITTKIIDRLPNLPLTGLVFGLVSEDIFLFASAGAEGDVVPALV